MLYNRQNGKICIIYHGKCKKQEQQEKIIAIEQSRKKYHHSMNDDMQKELKEER